MRINFKIIFLVFIGFILYGTILLWIRCGANLRSNSLERKIDIYSISQKLKVEGDQNSDPQSNSGTLNLFKTEEIDCSINGDYTIRCRKEGEEVYIPFSFIHKYFEVYGKLTRYNGADRFEWSHSYARVHQPKRKYTTEGVFTYFENYKVEERDRVKCISGMEGVPVTTQWKPAGYFYPTQIAQFGLAHYSKNLTEPKPRRSVIAHSHSVDKSWIIPEGSLLTSIITNDSNTIRSTLLKFSTVGDEGVTLNAKFNSDFVLSVDLKLNVDASSCLQVTLMDLEKKEFWFLNYICGNFFIKAKKPHIYHGIKCNEWTFLVRDLFIDLQKGLVALKIPKKQIFRSKLRISNLKFFGSGLCSSIFLSTNEHSKQFFAAAEWLVTNQNNLTGGWANPVQRKLAPGFRTLEPGWYSAMGQGHAISLLARAYYVSKNSKYLKAAFLGLKPFHALTNNGGVVTHFMDQLPWFEEYPTTPSSFTLNGFIYSLIGLYDLVSVAPVDKKEEASLLLNEGLDSLKKMLLFYDTGSGSMYDLRHLTLHVAPNLARWDYHATHVNQLLLLHTIFHDPIFLTVGTRWQDYMKGTRAQHN
nr:PREDICTED: D-glucuronyl C5-epimerase [Bemisia tabaci]